MKSAFKRVVDFVIGYNYTGYGNLKIGKDGVVGVISEIMKKSKIAYIAEKGVTTIIDYCFGFIG